MKIASREIGPNRPVFLQAEVGTTHNGDVNRALALVDAAADAGLDACKFIVTDPEKIGAASAPYAYETATGSRTAPIGRLLHDTLLTPHEWRRVRDRCVQQGLIFYATADHVEAVYLLEGLQVPVHKCSSWDIAYRPLHNAMFATGKPVVMEVGTATEQEWLDVSIGPHWHQIIPMLAPHPHEAADWNLRRLWGQAWGFSSPGRPTWCDFVELARGASMIEKRLTLDRSELAGHHHWISLDPAEMRAWVRQVRMAEAALAEDPWAGTEAAWMERRCWDRDAHGLRHGHE